MTPHLLQCLTFMSAVYLVSSQSEPALQLSESQKALLYGRPRNFVRTANASKTSFTEEEKSVLLQLHNAYRSMAQPPAQNMRELVWDTDLEEYARQHSQACSGGHSARSMVKVWSPLVSERWDLMGENLYWSYGDRYSIEEAMWMFWEEGSGYDIYNNTCNHRLTCGHYKALVLESSWRVGCSINQCDRFTDNPYPGPAMFMTCNYNGMYIDTDRPYTVGDSCSGCTRRSVGSQFANCRHRLCVSSRQLRGGTGFDGNTALIGIQHSDFTSGDDRTDLHTRELTTPPVMQITTTTTPMWTETTQIQRTSTPLETRTTTPVQTTSTLRTTTTTWTTKTTPMRTTTTPMPTTTHERTTTIPWWTTTTTPMRTTTTPMRTMTTPWWTTTTTTTPTRTTMTAWWTTTSTPMRTTTPQWRTTTAMRTTTTPWWTTTSTPMRTTTTPWWTTTSRPMRTTTTPWWTTTSTPMRTTTTPWWTTTTTPTRTTMTPWWTTTTTSMRTTTTPWWRTTTTPMRTTTPQWWTTTRTPMRTTMTPWWTTTSRIRTTSDRTTTTPAPPMQTTPMQTTTSAIRPTSTPQPTTTSTPQPTTTSTTIRTWPTTPKQTTGTVSTDTSQLHNSDTTTFYAVSIQTVTSFGQDPNSEWAVYPGSFNSGRSSGGPHRRQIVVICFLLSIFSFYTALE